MFDNIYRKLEKELHEKKKQMANIIEISNQAYEARDQAQMEIAAIQQADAKETQEYDETMVSLGKQLEEDKRRKDMMMRDQAKELAEKEEEEKRMKDKREAPGEMLKKKLARRPVWNVSKTLRRHSIRLKQQLALRTSMN